MLSRVIRSVARAPVSTSFARRCFSTKYTPSHEYLTLNGNVGTIGITDFAQNALGDVVYVELPAVGDQVTKGEVFGSVESVKAASDIYAPASGKVVEINEKLSDEPNLVNEGPTTTGWFIKIELDNADETTDMLDEAAYQEHCNNAEH
ncbi:unnamed protein product [Aphanomyces euteiches]|uniref:Glycine cleavage system H protein n=1 Tax=Aphanomyces euteiches TaxID=100861 RepID=A0A6G0XLN1_9STRA|nr:hypothetical protein Ae201684_003402 [Aphanomyces euteiches]KAG9409438.1 hypothetical protein AC1031_019698 [Aphanomyces cochlioides]KAH9098493.1 hypothetical protein Ae201684P_017705 [Aphanomyces euteiches]KAH9102557.1 hypothetical protein AeMF1_020844 [Aphanomyces euteiches]KAH9107377.1 hypothetical protein LEN26_014301 [Aphanomyces euteiches]